MRRRCTPTSCCSPGWSERCDGPDDPDADVIDSVARLVALYDEQHEELPRRNQFSPGRELVAAAAVVARTPAAGP